METLTDFIEEAKRVVGIAEQNGLALRIIGSVASRIHCSKFEYLLKTLKRDISDIDLVAGNTFRKSGKELLMKLGYVPNDRFIALHGMVRQIYYDQKHNNRTLDIFIEKLEMCHRIDFKDRLKLDFPTITLADLILTKTQIVKLNEKDIKDVIVILREHAIGDKEDETVNAKHIAKILGNDWGFYHTVTVNLGIVKEHLRAFDTLTDEDRVDVETKIQKLLSYIEKEPKSFGWNVRSKIGTKKKWYQDISDLYD